MELKDVKVILNRIKVNYPTFVNDDYTRTEWYKELKDYSLDDVMEKLEQLRRNTEKAYQSALKAMLELVDAITEERNYYRDLCNEKNGEM